MQKEKIMIGMSGGVDSSVAAALLLKEGYDVFGATLRLFDKDGECHEAADAKDVCQRLQIPHTVIDLRKEFLDGVITEFIDEYIKGRTPNPCIVCNRKIKFGAMLNSTQKNGCSKIATGHYAFIKKDKDRYLLVRPADINKDQTYVLYNMTQDVLGHTVFPLAAISKEEARVIAEEYGFLNAHKKDSQDICFVPDGDYASFIEKTLGKTAEKGNFVDANGKVLGQHNGIIRYTIGQRKGLGIALGKPAFVLKKDVNSNCVVLGDEDALFYKRVLVEAPNFIPFDRLEAPLRVWAKLRYRQKEQPAVIHPINENQVMVEFDNPQRAPSSGQAAVFYDGDIVVGGGIIVRGIE